MLSTQKLGLLFRERLHVAAVHLGLERLDGVEAKVLLLSGFGFALTAVVNSTLLSNHQTATRAHDAKPLANVMEADDKVRHRPAGLDVWNSADDQQLLYKKDAIFTGESRRTTISFPESGTTIDLDKDTLLVIDDLEQDNGSFGSLAGVLSGSERSIPAQVRVKIGGKEVTIDKGSNLKVSKKIDGSVAVAVLTGNASVAAPDGKASTKIAPNQVLDVSSKNPAATVHALPVVLDLPAANARQAFNAGTSVHFAWKAQAEAVAFRLELHRADIKDAPPVVIRTKTPSADVGVTSPDHYTWRVIAVDAAGKDLEASEERRLTLIDSRPPRPEFPADGQILSAFETAENHATGVATGLAWSSPLRDSGSAGADDGQLVRVQLAREGAFTQPLLDQTTTSLQIKSPELPPGTYEWRVSYESAADLGSAAQHRTWSGVRRLVVRGVPLPKPPQLSLPASGQVVTLSDMQATVSLAWESSSVVKATNYQLEIGRDSALQGEDVSRHVVSDTRFAWPAAGVGEVYWRVRTVDPSGRATPFSTVRSFKVALAPLALKTPAAKSRQVMERDDDKAAVAFAWEAAPLAASYRLQVDHRADFTNPTLDQELEDKHFSWSAATGGDYVWRVLAVDKDGHTLSTSTAWSLAVLDARGFVGPELTAPKPDEVFDATRSQEQVQDPNNHQNIKNAKGGQDIDFAWDAVAKATGYRLEVSEGAREDGGKGFAHPVFSEVIRDQHRLLHLLHVGAYHWRVGALIADDLPPRYGEVRQFEITRSDPPPSQVTQEPREGTVFVLDPEPQALSFSWKTGAAKEGETYEIAIAPTHDFSTVSFHTQTSDAHAAATLAAGTYFWRVRAVDSYGQRGQWSPAVNFTVKRRPLAPSFLIGQTAYRWQHDSSQQDHMQDTEQKAQQMLEFNYLGHLPMVKLRWQPLPVATVRYHLDVAKDAGFKEMIWSQDAQGTAAERQLKAGQYFARLAAIDSQGTSSFWSQALPIRVIQEPLLDPPQLLAPLPAKTFSYRRTAPLIAFAWGAVPKSSAYQFEVVSADGHTVGSSGKPLPAIQDVQPSPQPTVAMPLTAGIYQWRLRSIDADGRKGKWGETQSVTVQINQERPMAQAPLSDIDVDVDSAAVHDTPVTFRWQRVSDLSDYQLVVSSDAGFKHIVASHGSGDGTSATVPLVPGRSYYWYVEGVNLAENEPVRSTIASFGLTNIWKPSSRGPGPHTLDVFALAAAQLVNHVNNLDGSSSAVSSNSSYGGALLGLGLTTHPKEGFGLAAEFAMGSATIPDENAAETQGRGHKFSPTEASIAGFYRQPLVASGLAGDLSLGLADERSYVIYATGLDKTGIRSIDVNLAEGGAALRYDFGSEQSLEAAAHLGTAFDAGESGVRSGKRYRFSGGYGQSVLAKNLRLLASYEFMRSQFYYRAPSLGLGGTIQADQYYFGISLLHNLDF